MAYIGKRKMEYLYGIEASPAPNMMMTMMIMRLLLVVETFKQLQKETPSEDGEDGMLIKQKVMMTTMIKFIVLK